MLTADSVVSMEQPTVFQELIKPVEDFVKEQDQETKGHPFSCSPPVIHSTPPVQAIVDQPYHYAIQAEDANDDPLSYQLDTAPEGMQLDLDGLIHWTPTAAQVGYHDLRLRVSDPGGGYAHQHATLANKRTPIFLLLDDLVIPVVG